MTKPTVATHLATKKDKIHLLVHAPSVISLHYQRSRSPILFLYLRILCFTHHLPIFRAYLSPFNQCHSHHTQSKRLSSPLEQSIQVQTLSALTKLFQTFTNRERLIPQARPQDLPLQLKTLLPNKPLLKRSLICSLSMPKILFPLSSITLPILPRLELSQ